MKTVSLQLAQELRKAGYPQEGNEFSWVRPDRGEFVLWHYSKLSDPVTIGWDDIAAPTADEILDRLPDYILKSENRTYYIQIHKKPYGEYEILYQLSDSEILGGDPADGRNKNASHALDKSLADAAAKMWLYLKKENLL